MRSHTRSEWPTRGRRLAAFLGLALLVAGGARIAAVHACPGRGEGPSAPTRPAAPEVSATMSDDRPTQHYRELTPEEERVIVQKGTEAPFTGEYDNYFEAGVYTCRRCGAMLYRSEDKFHSDCGWPAFDDEIRGAVQRVPDPDGVRTEIVCANCGAHLGHVFTGEQLTEKNTRFCVNSISLLFVPADQVHYGRAIFAGGCFWGVEYWLDREPGVVRARSGYAGGWTQSPTYELLHTTDTGHAEAVEVLYDPVRVTYEHLAKLFFGMHDPTQRNGQGPDLGPAYRSAVMPLDDEQRATAERLIGELKAKGLDVVTEIWPVGAFWPAEDYHQDYFEKRGASPTCHFLRQRW